MNLGRWGHSGRPLYFKANHSSTLGSVKSRRRAVKRAGRGILTRMGLIAPTAAPTAAPPIPTDEDASPRREREEPSAMEERAAAESAMPPRLGGRGARG